MAVALDSVSPRASGPLAGDSLIATNALINGGDQSRNGGVSPNRVGDELTVTAYPSSPTSPDLFAMAILNSMNQSGGTPATYASALAPTVTSPSTNEAQDFDRFSAVSSFSTTATGGAVTPGFGPLSGLNDASGDTQLPLSAPEPSTLVLVVAAVPVICLLSIRRRSAAI